MSYWFLVNKDIEPYRACNMSTCDLLLTNGHFITLDDNLPEATSCAILQGNIAWVGKESDAGKFIGPNTKVLDLKSAYVYPGFIDSHAHIFYTGHTKNYQLNLNATKDKASVLEKVREWVQLASPGEWIMGIGWDEHNWPDPIHPTCHDLDNVSPNNPVFLRRVDTHAVWVNSAVLKLAGIDQTTPDVEGGKVYRDKYGKPTGILLDKAIKLIYPFMPHLGLDETVKVTQGALQDALQKGITMIHNAATFSDELEAYKALAASHALDVRIYAMMVVPSDEAEKFLQSGPVKISPFLEVRCLKFFMDGAMGSRGSSLLAPYEDDAENHGLLIWQPEDLIAKLKRAKENGFQVAIHAIGDRANHEVLNAYEEVGIENLRWRIEHAQLLSPSDVPRFSALQVISSMQPLHLVADMPWIEVRLGSLRAKNGAFLWRSLLDSGARIAGGSDAPVVDINPLLGIYAAITRQDLDGNPKEGWCKEERVTPLQALRMYTIDAAYACFREHELGTITPGKLADLVVLPGNILKIDPQALLDMSVLYTIVNGKIKYQGSPPAPKHD